MIRTADADQLVARARQGDKDALAELLVSCRHALRQAVKIGREYQAVLSVDDIEQVTHYEVLLRINGFRATDHDSFLRWVIHIAQRNVISAIRGLNAAKRPPPHQRVSAPASEDSCGGLLETLARTSRTPSREFAHAEVNQILRRAIQRLPQDYQVVVQLYDLQGHTGAEVAVLMGRSTGAVYMLRARAHDWLREVLGRESRLL